MREGELLSLEFSLDPTFVPLGLMPVTGLPLPFLSSGGSSMLACWLALGLLAGAQQDRPGAWRRGLDLTRSAYPQGRQRRS